jgi:flagellar biogenesis protein FliO
VIDNTATHVPPPTEAADDAILDKPLKRKTQKSAETETDAENADAAAKPHGWKNKVPRPDWNMSFSPVISVAGSLLIVLSAFFMIAVLYKKVSPKGNRPLPKEAFENLGRVYITAKQQLQLLRLGNRLILVSVTANGTSPVCEITDPDEAVSLLGMCRRLDTNSATELFQKTVSKISDDEINQSVRASRRPPQQHSRTSSPLVDLYSDPDETLAEMLAKSGRR